MTQRHTKPAPAVRFAPSRIVRLALLVGVSLIADLAMAQTGTAPATRPAAKPAAPAKRAPAKATPPAKPAAPVEAAPAAPAVDAPTAPAEQADRRSPAGGALDNVPEASASVPETKGLSSILPEGKTLPAETVRVRLPFKFLRGSEGYDKDGNKSSTGYQLTASAVGAVVEYGWSDRLSLQFLAPVVLRNELDFNKKTFLNRDNVKAGRAAGREQIIGGLAQVLTAQGVEGCPAVAACYAAIASGQVANVPQDGTTIPNTNLRFSNQAPILAQIDAITEAGALADPRVIPDPEDGKTGLGDVQLGFLYALVEEGPVLFSAGAGIRFPTGSFKDVDADQRPTGRGTTDFGVRLNLDLPLARPVMVSWQNQSELMIAKGSKEVGDKTVDFERKGIRNVGYLKTAFALAGVTDALKPVAVYAQYGYDFDGEERIDGTGAGVKKQARSGLVGITVSGLESGIPISLDLEQERPMAQSKNVLIATTSTNVTIKAYAKF